MMWLPRDVDILPTIYQSLLVISVCIPLGCTTSQKPLADILSTIRRSQVLIIKIVPNTTSEGESCIATCMIASANVMLGVSLLFLLLLLCRS